MVVKNFDLNLCFLVLDFPVFPPTKKMVTIKILGRKKVINTNMHTEHQKSI